MYYRTAVFGVIIIASMVAVGTVPAATAEVPTQSNGSSQGEAYAGAHVSFETTGNAVVDYAVNGETIVENVSVDASESARSGLGIGAGAGVSAITDVAGASLGAQAQARASVTVESESGATISAHDNGNGVLQVKASDESQIATVDLGGEATANQQSDGRIVVESGGGTEGTFLLVGSGDLAVNDEGDVTAEIESGGELVYRQYENDRSQADEERERMIAEGTAAAEVYVQQSTESGQETIADAVEYGNDTTVEVAQESSSTVELTVERTQSEGRVIASSVSKETFEAAEELTVTVDGEAAAKADSSSAVEQTAKSGDEPAFYVEQSSSAEATVDVFVGIHEFSTRTVTMTGDDGSSDGGSDSSGDGESSDSSDGGSSEDGSSGDSGSGSTPGFGVGIALVAILGAALLARRRN